MSEGATQFEVTLKVTALTEQHVTDYCITHLRDRGYSVKAPRDRSEKIKDYLARIGVAYMTFARSLEMGNCPPVNIRRSPAGRALEIQSNDAFDEFVTRNVVLP